QGQLLSLPEDMRRVLFSADPAFLAAALDSIEQEFGGVESYLAQAGVTDAQLQQVRDRLLEQRYWTSNLALFISPRWMSNRPSTVFQGAPNEPRLYLEKRRHRRGPGSDRRARLPYQRQYRHGVGTDCGCRSRRRPPRNPRG